MMSTATAITVYVNDEPRTLAAGETLPGLVRELGVGERKGVALAVNGSVVPRKEWAERALVEGDRVLVIQATQGG